MSQPKHSALRITLGAVALCAACGGSASGGAAAGGTGSGGSSAGACTGASITFKLLVAPGSATTYCVATSAFTCGLGNWLSIRSSDGSYLSQDGGRCTSSCGTCAELPCSNICLEPEAVGSDGVEATFDGSYFVPKTCGAGIACVDSGCATPGNYVARMCGSTDPNNADAPTCSNAGFGSPQDCVEVPFTWPPAASGATISGTIGGAAGASGG